MVSNHRRERLRYRCIAQPRAISWLPGLIAARIRLRVSLNRLRRLATDSIWRNWVKNAQKQGSSQLRICAGEQTCHSSTN